MCNEMVIRRFAGAFVLASALLAWLVSPWWLLFTAFVGVNLVQSSVTNCCPLEKILAGLNLFGCRPGPRSAQ